MSTQWMRRMSCVLFLCIVSKSTFAFILTLKPGPSAGKDAYFDTPTPNTNYGNHTEMGAVAWQCSVNPCNARGIIQFDLTSIPVNAIVASARISLYAAPTPLQSLLGQPPMNGNNQAVLQRVTSSWNENTVTWNNAPSTTTLNQVTLPQSSNPNQNYLNIDVKNIIQDMISNPATSFGFLFRLPVETPLASMIFASSDCANSALWPEITIEYHLPTSIQPLAQNSYCAGSLVTVQYNNGGNVYNAGNSFTAQLSDANGNFSSPVSIGSVVSTSSGTINAIIPANSPFGNGYRIRVVSSNPITTSSTNGSNIIIPNSDDSNACTIDACNTSTGILTHSPVNINDNNACTSDGCNSITGIFHNLISVDDGNACTIDLCDALLGEFHFPVPVSDNDLCTIDACNSLTGTITHTNIISDDGNSCTNDGCDPINGVFHSPVNISDNDECTIDVCNSLSGSITHVSINVDDNNACTTDGCNSITGVYHISVPLSDGNECTIDYCDVQIGVIHVPVNTNDNNLCTVDACDPVTGNVTHDAVVTDDGNPCTIDFCNSVAGIFHNPIDPNDNNACTIDGCNSVTGVYNTAIATDDSNVCTIDACDPSTGVVTHVDDSPVITTTAGEILCYGGNTCVTVSGSGGTPPYFNEGVFCGYNAGVYYFDITDNKGCVTTSGPVIIGEPVKINLATTSTPSGCITNDGSATVFGFGGTPPYDFIWNPGNQTGSNATNLAPGNYTVTCTDHNGCIATASVTVGTTGTLPAPPSSVSGPAGVCAKQTGVVYCVSNPDPLHSYEWTLPQGVSVTGGANGPCVTLKFSSKFKGGFICVKAVNSCGTSSVTCQNVMLITRRPITPGGISGPLSLCPNQTATYSVSPVPEASSYSWSEDNMTILSGQGTNTIVVKADAGFNSGRVKVKAVNCKGVSGERKMNVAVNPVCRLSSANNNNHTVSSARNISIYPNPNQGKFILDFNSLFQNKTTVKVLDLTGKVVYEETITASQNVTSKEFNPGNLSRGIYLVTVSDDNVSRTLRIIVE